MVWTSNISGELGTGAECIVKNLPVGMHIITATAINSAAERGRHVGGDGFGGQRGQQWRMLYRLFVIGDVAAYGDG